MNECFKTIVCCLVSIPMLILENLKNIIHALLNILLLILTLPLLLISPNKMLDIIIKLDKDHYKL